MRNWVRSSPTTVAVDLVILGFFVIGAGWFGASREDAVAGQIPYLLSGGVLGLALILGGLTLLLIHAIRSEAAELARQLEKLGSGSPAAPTGVLASEEIEERKVRARKARARRRKSPATAS